MRENFTDGTRYEPIVGFSRAVRAGDHVFVSGTVGWNEEGVLPADADMYEQTRLAIRHIERTLARAGAKLSDVVRTRIYVTNADYWEAIGRVHGRYFADIRPANALVEVSRLVGSEYLVEIEADAVISGE